MATTKPKVIKKKEKVEETPFQGKYLYAVGRRKTAVAQVRLYVSKEGAEAAHVINKKPISIYFPENLQTVAVSPLALSGLEGKFQSSVSVRGGGVSAQAEAVRLGVARALLLHDETLRLTLRAHGLLTRDARSVERKKPGLKKARRAPQWSKR